MSGHTGRFATDDLDNVCNIILLNEYKKVALQFPEEVLSECIQIYEYFHNKLCTHSVNLYIIADSAYGSSVDDIAAQHIDRDVSVYFGSDLIGTPSNTQSSSVITVSERKSIDVDSCIVQINGSITTQYSNILLIHEACYYNYIEEIESCLKCNNNCMRVYRAEYSGCSIDVVDKLKSSVTTIGSSSSSSSRVDAGVGSTIAIAGLTISNEFIEKVRVRTSSDANSATDTVSTAYNNLIIYVGEKDRQLFCVAAYFNQIPILSYNPLLKSIEMQTKCSDSKVFRDRYGGISKVMNAKIIGIIVGSMGITGDIMMKTVKRLKTLIRASRKSYYYFVIGRLNESKLCNFPDIDLFCLLSNETEIIKPKTYHCPVLTPWELEVGLGARDWDDTCKTNLEHLLQDDIDVAIARVKASYQSNNDDGSDSEEDEGIVSETSLVNESYNNIVAKIQTFNTIERFSSREFTGLDPNSSNHSTDIQLGVIGIAAGYSRIVIDGSE